MVRAVLQQDDAHHQLEEALRSHMGLSAAALLCTHVSDAASKRALLSAVAAAAQADLEHVPGAALGTICWSAAAVPAKHRPVSEIDALLAGVLQLLQQRRTVLRLAAAYEAGKRAGTILRHGDLDQTMMLDVMEAGAGTTVFSADGDAGASGTGSEAVGDAVGAQKRGAAEQQSDSGNDSGGRQTRKVLMTKEGVRVEFIDDEPVFPSIPRHLHFSHADMANIAFAARVSAEGRGAQAEGETKGGGGGRVWNESCTQPERSNGKGMESKCRLFYVEAAHLVLDHHIHDVSFKLVLPAACFFFFWGGGLCFYT